MEENHSWKLKNCNVSYRTYKSLLQRGGIYWWLALTSYGQDSNRLKVWWQRVCVCLPRTLISNIIDDTGGLWESVCDNTCRPFIQWCCQVLYLISLPTFEKWWNVTCSLGGLMCKENLLLPTNFDITKSPCRAHNVVDDARWQNT